MLEIGKADWLVQCVTLPGFCGIIRNSRQILRIEINYRELRMYSTEKHFVTGRSGIQLILPGYLVFLHQYIIFMSLISQ